MVVSKCMGVGLSHKERNGHERSIKYSVKRGGKNNE